MQTVQSRLIVKRAVLTVAAMLALSGTARAVDVDVRFGDPRPREQVVVVDDAWLVGPRRALYDADWRLRLAQTAEFRASDNLTATRDREADVMARVDAAERRLDDTRHALAEREAMAGASQEKIDRAKADLEAARSVADAAARKADAAKADLETARKLGNQNPDYDAAARFHRAAADAAAAEADLDAAMGHLEQVRRTSGDTAAVAELKAHLADDQAAADRQHEEVLAIHDAVYAAQRGLEDAHHDVSVALHDRDEALWLIHRDDLISGALEPAACGFVIDVDFFRRHRHEPEILHSYCVRDTSYWIERPVEVHTRIVEVERVTEITRVREYQRVREPVRIREVERIETTVRPETRQKIAEVVKVEHGAYTKERQERVLAESEKRKPQLQPFIARSSHVTGTTVVPTHTSGTSVNGTSVTGTSVTGTTVKPTFVRPTTPVTATPKETEVTKPRRDIQSSERTTTVDDNRSRSNRVETTVPPRSTTKLPQDDSRTRDPVKVTEPPRRVTVDDSHKDRASDRGTRTVTPADTGASRTGSSGRGSSTPTDTGSSSKNGKGKGDPNSTGTPSGK